MTLGEYAKQISDELKKVSSYQEALPILNAAQRTLENSNLTVSEHKLFWNTIQQYYSLNAVVEKQDSTAVNSVIAAIQAAIANKVK